jgi:hypothetical protein
VALLAFSAVVWNRHLCPWWQVALRRQDASAIDALAGCFCTRASARFPNTRRAEPHAYRPVGESVVALAHGRWVT